MMKRREPCDHGGWVGLRVIVPGDLDPRGWRWPRCMLCGHRTDNDGDKPTSTRRLMLKDPMYLFTELRGRWIATHWESWKAKHG